jgi:transposase InsO family protein
VCSYFNISRQAYYWHQKERYIKSSKDLLILEMVYEIRRKHSKMGGKKLYSKLEDDIHLLDKGFGRDKFFKLLRDNDLLIKNTRKYAITTNSFHHFYKYGDLFNGVIFDRPNKAYVGDITYIRTVKGFVYLSLLTDSYSRKIVGHAVCLSLETVGPLGALRMALKQCPEPKTLVHHSDRGVQYCSYEYVNVLKGAGVKISMGEAGNCYDNAKAERVNGILKQEYGLDDTFFSIVEVSKAVKQGIWLYNQERPHWGIGLKTPSQVHLTTNLSTKFVDC